MAYIWQVSNLIYVDQPIGTGFSYSSDDDDIRHSEEGVSNDLYDFLQVSFNLLYRESSTCYFNFYILTRSLHDIRNFSRRIHNT